MKSTTKVAGGGRYLLKLGRQGGSLVTRLCEKLMGRWFVIDTFDGRVMFDRGRVRGLTFAYERKERQRLNPIRDVLKARLGGYMRLRRAFLAGRSMCERCRERPSRDVHHTRGRCGDLLTQVQWWLALCRKCHDWVRDNPAKSSAETVSGIPLLGRAWNHEAEGGRTDVSQKWLEEWDRGTKTRHRKAFAYGKNAETPTKTP